MQMKILIPLWLGMVFCAVASPQHHVVFVAGRAEVGRVVTLTEDALVFQPEGQQTTREMALDSVLYVHNGAGKLFFVSKRLETFLERARGRGGVLVTVDGQGITFRRLMPRLFMVDPRIDFVAEGREDLWSLPLERIHRILVDRSLSEFAARKGFYAGMGISLIRFLLKFKSINQVTRLPATPLKSIQGR